jgi:XTP/dITP diphosphohydrolase
MTVLMLSGEILKSGKYCFYLVYASVKFMHQKILIATSNPGKKREILGFFGKKLSHNFMALSGIPESEKWSEPEENASSFEGNAQIKAKHFGTLSHLPTIGEDSGLILSAFPEKFGLRTKREIQAEDDMEWLVKFLELLEGQEDRRVTFYSAITFFDPQKNTAFSVLGQSSGTIALFPQAPLKKGIPVSSVFIPDGAGIVLAAMEKSEKDRISHRAQSAKKIWKYLTENHYLH